MLWRICIIRQCRPLLVLIAAFWPSVAGAQDSGAFAYPVTCPVVSGLPLCTETAGDWSVCPDEPRVEGSVLWQVLEARDPGYAYIASELTCRGKLGGRDMVATLFLRHNVCRVNPEGEGFRCRRPLKPFLAFVGDPLPDGPFGLTPEKAQDELGRRRQELGTLPGDAGLDLQALSRNCACAFAPCPCDKPEYWAVARFKEAPDAEGFCRRLGDRGVDCRIEHAKKLK